MNMMELIREIELMREVDGYPAKVTATPIKEETEYGYRIIGWKCEIIIMMNGILACENE